MSYNCCWCGSMILDWTYATLFLSRPIHNDCLKKLEREFKKEYGIKLQELKPNE